jgi:F0F1-type ATP synthase membrane subunit b/b'
MSENPVQQILDAEKQARGILEGAKKEAERKVDTAKKELEEKIESIKRKKIESLSQELQQEKVLVKKAYEKAIRDGNQKTALLEKEALSRVESAAERVTTAFLHFFSQK